MKQLQLLMGKSIIIKGWAIYFIEQLPGFEGYLIDGSAGNFYEWFRKVRFTI